MEKFIAVGIALTVLIVIIVIAVIPDKARFVDLSSDKFKKWYQSANYNFGSFKSSTDGDVVDYLDVRRALNLF